LAAAIRRLPAAVAVCIGCWASAAQSTPAQGAGELLLHRADSDWCVQRFELAFRTDQAQRWHEGFRLAQVLGPAAVPLLAALAQDEANARRRHLLIAAMVLAAGETAADLPLRELQRRGRQDSSESYLALWAIAVGPQLESTQATLPAWIAVKDASPAIQAACAAALARVRGDVRLPPALWRSDDAGVVAACLLAAAPPSDSIARLERWWRPRPDGARQLVWRATLLSEHGAGADDEMRLRCARAALAESGLPAALRLAAATCIGRSLAPRELLAGLPDPEPELLPALAYWPPGRTLAAQLGWLEVPPPARLPAATRGQLAVLHAWTRPPAAALASAGRVAGDAQLVGPLCLAIATLALRAPGGAETLPPAPHLAAVPESVFLALARGEPAEVLTGSLADPVLERHAQLLARNRLSRPVVAAALERGMWRRGVHPGCLQRQLRLELLRDLLLGGSRRASERYGLGGAYLPHGVDPGNDLLFGIACELYEFVRASEPGDLQEYRLRGN
jgi:hypothetical protein